MSKNLENLKAAYSAWDETKGGSAEQWLELFSDSIRIRSISEDTPGLSFARDRHSKAEAVEYLTSILAEWSMVHWTVDQLLEDGDQVAMFGHCAWTNKKTGKTAEVLAAALWKFEDGRIVEFTEIFDTARAAVAAMPDG